MIKKLICISCPMGCELSVEQAENGDVLLVTGNLCKRGDVYGRKEVTAPTRTVTSTVRVTGGNKPLVSVRTKTDIPKDKIWDCMEWIQKASAAAPVAVGDVIIENIAGTGVPLVATSPASKREDSK